MAGVLVLITAFSLSLSPSLQSLPPSLPPSDALSLSHTQVAKLKEILTGETSIGINLEFLYRNNKTDMLLLNNIKVHHIALPE